MKILLGAILGVALASSPLLAQEPGDKEKQKQQEPKGQEPKNQEPSSQPKANQEKKQEAPPKQQKSDEKRQQQDTRQQQQQQKDTEKQSKDNEKRNHENNQAQPQQRQQNGRQYAQESHSRGERIPPQKFQASFGSEHHFRVSHLDEGRRFEYSGYAFEMVQPWPSDWSYNDECYIEQDADDYYLVDTFHPGIRVLVIVV